MLLSWLISVVCGCISCLCVLGLGKCEQWHCCLIIVIHGHLERLHNYALKAVARLKRLWLPNRKKKKGYRHGNLNLFSFINLQLSNYHIPDNILPCFLQHQESLFISERLNCSASLCSASKLGIVWFANNPWKRIWAGCFAYAVMNTVSLNIRTVFVFIWCTITSMRRHIERSDRNCRWSTLIFHSSL